MRVIPYRKVSDLDGLLCSRIEETGACATSCFVVPSRRDRDWWRLRVRATYAGSEARFGDRTLLWNWEDIYNDIRVFLGRPKLRQIDSPDHRVILSFIVNQFLSEDEYRGLLSALPGLSRPGFIDILADDLRELINEAVSPEQLATAERGGFALKILPELYRRYIEYLDANNLMDSSQIPIKTLETLCDHAEAWFEDRALTFVGFMSFTGGQLALVRKIEALSPRDVVVFKPTTDLDDFHDATKQLEGVTWENEPPSPGGTVISLLSSESNIESEMIARLLALWREGEGELAKSAFAFPGFGAIGLSTADRRLLPMESALRRYHIPYVTARGRSISKNILGANLGSIWTAWTEGLETYKTALLLSQPWAGTGSDFSVSDAERHGPSGAGGWESYLKQKDCKSALRALKAITKFCRALEKGATPEGILGALYDFLKTRGLWVSALLDMFADYPDLDESLRELAASVDEVEDKRNALRELQPDLGPAGGVTVKGSLAMRFLNDWCRDTMVSPAPPILGAVTLYTGFPPILASHPVWIMTDVTQKAWPGQSFASPLLNEREREMIATAEAWLPSAHDKRVQREALFRRLLQTGDELTIISRASTDDEGRPTARASLLDSFFEDMKNWTLTDDVPVFGPAALSPGDTYFPDIETPDAAESPKDIENLVKTPILRAPETNLSFPVGELDELLSCPMRWRLARRARVKSLDRELFNKTEAGNLTHKIWENVWSNQLSGGETPSSAVEREWKKALNLERGYADYKNLLQDRRLERRRKNIEFYIARLARLQDGILERLDDCAVRGQAPRRAGCEQEVTLTPYELDGVRFTGRCDRMDVFEDGSVVILDYKLGKSESYEKKLGALEFKWGLQLSAYALLRDSDTSGARGAKNRGVAGVGFLGHGDGALAGTFEPPFDLCYLGRSVRGARLSERMEEARDAMRRAAAILKLGEFMPRYESETCGRCDFKGVCRKGEIRGEVKNSEDDDE